MVAGPSGGLPYTLTTSLTGTILLYSDSPLSYGSSGGLASGVPLINTADHNYFTGRSDGFAPGVSGNPNNARLDPEAIRMSNDGKTLVGFMQSPLLQDGGDGGRANRIVTIDIASGGFSYVAQDIQPVPEPETLGLFLLGLAVMGFGLRRKFKTV